VVNGKIQPFHQVQRRKYRFRFLNGSNARFYQIFLTNRNGRSFPFDMIATEGGLLARPIRGITSFRIAPAERVEVVIDFSEFREGDEVFIENRLEQVDGRGPKRLLSQGPRILKFLVDGVYDNSDNSQVPDVLRPFDPISREELARAPVRTFVFERQEGNWAINGQPAFDLNRPAAQPRLNVGEIWRLVNKSGGWNHPIHPHLDQMRVLRRNGKEPPLHERDGMGRKDTVNLGPNEEADVFIKFRDFPGPFVFHCHNLEHEDHRMMARVDMVGEEPSCSAA
jgi:FtsP/CotA-like multicopper oxidase with cupredoxin domain